MAIKKFTNAEFLELYNDPNYTSDEQIGKALGVATSPVWERRIKLGLRPMTLHSQKTPEECHKKHNKSALKSQLKHMDRIKPYSKAYYWKHRVKYRAYAIAHKKAKTLSPATKLL